MGAFGDDKLDFYGADLGPAQSVALTTTSAPSGRLAPGRYLVQFIDTSTNRVWARSGPFSVASPVVAVTAAPSTPFAANGPTAFEINVRKNHNDQLAARMAAGTGTMIITPISRVPRA